jgi:hypothetical protein
VLSQVLSVDTSVDTYGPEARASKHNLATDSMLKLDRELALWTVANSESHGFEGSSFKRTTSCTEQWELPIRRYAGLCASTNDPARSRIMLRHILLSVAVIILFGQSSFDARSPAGQSHEIGGSYYCEGTDANGRPYRGTVSIGKHGDVYYLLWRFGSRRVAVGVGILQGDVLAVSYNGQSSGVAVYEIDGARLDGRWTDSGAPGRLLLETLTRIPHPKPEDVPGPVDSTEVPI